MNERRDEATDSSDDQIPADQIPPDEGWGSLPVTKFLCPVHGIPEDRQIVSQSGERMYRYACPVAGCGHEWTVKRIRA